MVKATEVPAVGGWNAHDTGDSNAHAPHSLVGGDNTLGEEANVVQYVTFFLGGEEYALPIEQVQEINRVGEITQVPNAPQHVVGVVNLRGRVVPVIELKRRLRLGTVEPGKDARIVVAENGTKILGLMVDRVAQVISLGKNDIDTAPEESTHGLENCTRGVGRADDRMIILLDLDKLASGTLPVSNR